MTKIDDLIGSRDLRSNLICSFCCSKCMIYFLILVLLQDKISTLTKTKRGRRFVQPSRCFRSWSRTPKGCSCLPSMATCRNGRIRSHPIYLFAGIYTKTDLQTYRHTEHRAYCHTDISKYHKLSTANYGSGLITRQTSLFENSKSRTKSTVCILDLTLFIA